MAKKVSLINMKGGVGKSTIAVNLAWHFAAKRDWGKNVLLVDLDPQFNASSYLLGVSRYKEILDKNKPTIWDVFEQHTYTPGKKRSSLNPEDVITNVRQFYGGGHIDLIPSRLELAYSLKNPAQKELLLSKLISKAEHEYHLILIDCPPTESVFTIAAYLTTDFILVPVKLEYLSSIGVSLLVRSMDEFHKQYEGHKVKLAGLVFNSTSGYVPEEAESKRDVLGIAGKNGWYVFENPITYSRSYPKGASEGRPIFRTTYSRYSQCQKFSEFANEFAKRIGL